MSRYGIHSAKQIPFEAGYSKPTREEAAEYLSVFAKKVELRGNIQQFTKDYYLKSTNVLSSDILNNIISPYHCHDFYEINYVFEGTLLQYIDGEVFCMSAGDLLFIPAGKVSHISYPLEGTVARNLLMTEKWITDTEKQMSEHGGECFLSTLIKKGSCMYFYTDGQHGIQGIIEEADNIRGSYTEYWPYGGLLLESYMLRLMIALSRCEHSTLPYTARNFSKTADREEAIIRYVKDNYATANLEEFSARFGYSTRHIRRIVKERTHKNFSDFLTEVRLERSKYLLTKTTLPSKDIAEIIGFDSPEYFSRWFKAKEGVSPIEYREKRKMQD